MIGSDFELPSTAGLEPEDAKSALRSALRHHRNGRSLRRRTDAGDAIGIVAAHLLQSRGDRRIAVYASRPAEPSTAPLLERAERAGVDILLPVLGDGLSRQWATFKGLDDLIERAPGRPPEPSGPYLEMDEVATASLIFVPALALDTSGSRLGQGGGWYDRVLTHVSPNATILGIVFADEVFSQDEFRLPQEPHDQLVHGAVTPQGVQWFIEPPAASVL